MNLSLETVGEVAATITGIVTIASAVTAVTNTPKAHDQSIWRRIYKIIEFFALVTNKTKQM